MFFKVNGQGYTATNASVLTADSTVPQTFMFCYKEIAMLAGYEVEDHLPVIMAFNRNKYVELLPGDEAAFTAEETPCFFVKRRIEHE